MRGAVIALVAVLGSSTACSTPTVEPGPPGLAELAAARERWAETGYQAYTMVLVRQCFCPPEYRGPYEVRVEGGAVVAVVDVATGAPVPEGNARLFPSVDDLLDRIEAAIRRPVARLDVEYASRGYPVRVWVDEDERIADEESGFEIEALESVGSAP